MVLLTSKTYWSVQSVCVCVCVGGGINSASVIRNTILLVTGHILILHRWLIRSIVLIAMFTLTLNDFEKKFTLSNS